MKKNTINQLAIFAVVLALAIIVTQEIFKAMNLSLKDYPKFEYKGGENKTREYINWITPLAKAVGAEYGIPWKAIVAQSAWETGWGKDTLLRKYNNFGGIKDTDGVNSTEPLSTQEFENGQFITIKDGFEIFPSPYEGMRGYAEFIKKNKRYKNAFNYPNDPYKYIVEIKKAGYATDPNYVSNINSILNKYLA